jgi:hypothetical protein
MRANQHVIYPDEGPDIIVHAVERRQVLLASGEVRLVCHHDNGETCRFNMPNRFYYTRKNFEVLIPYRGIWPPINYVTAIDDAITIKK